MEDVSTQSTKGRGRIKELKSQKSHTENISTLIESFESLKSSVSETLASMEPTDNSVDVSLGLKQEKLKNKISEIFISECKKDPLITIDEETPISSDHFTALETSVSNQREKIERIVTPLLKMPNLQEFSEFLTSQYESLETNLNKHKNTLKSTLQERAFAELKTGRSVYFRHIQSKNRSHTQMKIVLKHISKVLTVHHLKN